MKKSSPDRTASELAITVVPRSARNRVEQQADGTWRVHVTAPPVDGAANDALLKLLASVLGIPRSRLCITAGQNSRHKRVQVEGIGHEALDHRLRQELLRSR